MFFRMVYKSGQIFLPFCHNTRVWQTDAQTDRRTDRRTEFSSQYRVCITCSAVKRERGRKGFEERRGERKTCGEPLTGCVTRPLNPGYATVYLAKKVVHVAHVTATCVIKRDRWAKSSYIVSDWRQIYGDHCARFVGVTQSISWRSAAIWNVTVLGVISGDQPQQLAGRARRSNDGQIRLRQLATSRRCGGRPPRLTLESIAHALRSVFNKSTRWNIYRSVWI